MKKFAAFDPKKPLILNPRLMEDVECMAYLRSVSLVWKEIDTLDMQIQDYIKCLYPDRKTIDEQTKINEIIKLTESDPKSYGRWIYFPWSGILTRILPPKEYTYLRLNRNHNKITKKEQEKLLQARIGIVGLSVGNAIAQTLALEGLFGEIRLADFDLLEVSNLNRIAAGIPQLYERKVDIAARQIYELNPFAQVTTFNEGITRENIDAFLHKGGKLDILVDECDSLSIKFLLREKCKIFGIPCIMETSDRGMLDIERFDEDPKRPCFHGLVDPEIRSKDLTNLTDDAKTSIILSILGVDSISPRLAASIVEIDHSLSTWPQLGSDVILGGAITAMAIKNIILGQTCLSGRRFVDAEKFLNNTEIFPFNNELSDINDQLKVEDKTKFLSQDMPEFIGACLHAASRATSPGNMQPWKFQYKHEKVFVFRSKSYQSLLDYQGQASLLSIGAAIRNIEICSEAYGLKTSISYPLKEDFVAEIAFDQKDPSLKDHSELFAYIEKRRTSRAMPESQQLLGPNILELLQRTTSRFGIRLEVLTPKEKQKFNELADLVGLGDRMRFLSTSLHQEVLNEITWTKHESERRKDGIFIEDLELKPGQLAAFRMLKRRDILNEIQMQKTGYPLMEMSRDLIRNSSAMVLLSVLDPTPEAFIQAGKGLQEMWLELTKEEIAVHPMTALIYLFKIYAKHEAAYSEEEKQEIIDLKSRFDGIFSESVNSQRLFLVRLSMNPSQLTQPTPRYDLKKILIASNIT